MPWSQAAPVDCMVEEIVRRGAVALEPDDLDQAIWDGFDYCEDCFDKSDPAPPVRGAAVTAGRSS